MLLWSCLILCGSVALLLSLGKLGFLGNRMQQASPEEWFIIGWLLWSGLIVGLLLVHNQAVQSLGLTLGFGNMGLNGLRYKGWVMKTSGVMFMTISIGFAILTIYLLV